MFELTVPVRPGEHYLGPSRTPVTVVEYGDFECPHCKQAAPAVKLLLARFAGQVRLAWRHFPLEEVHPHALGAALAAEASAAQQRFWPMHDLLLDRQRHLEPADLRRYAEHLGLDMARYDAETAAAVHLRRVREDIESGSASGVRATPTFYVNGVLQDVSYGLQRLFDKVQSEVELLRISRPS